VVVRVNEKEYRVNNYLEILALILRYFNWTIEYKWWRGKGAWTKSKSLFLFPIIPSLYKIPFSIPTLLRTSYAFLPKLTQIVKHM
jgi:hypothetical protein